MLSAGNSLDRLIQEACGLDKEDEECQLLYIGKSNSEKEGYDILKRLRKHETIQEIHRDKEMYYREMEIVIEVISFRSKRFENIEISPILNIMGGESSWELILDIKQNQEVIELIEAMLINHFKPKYNQQYKIDRTTRVYEKVVKEGIHMISVELDLSTQQGRMNLITNCAKTETKMRTLVCRCINDEIVIDYVDMPDCVYDMC